MIFLKLKLNNLYMFKDTEVDFTYPRKRPNSTIKHEYLKDFPNINFKRVNIFMGSNASGKTTLAKVMCGINNFLYGKELHHVKDAIHLPQHSASFELTYITPQTSEIHYLEVEINQKGIKKEVYRKQLLVASKSLPKTLEDVRSIEPTFYYDSEHLHNVPNPGFKSVGVTTGQVTLDSADNTFWHYLFSDGNTHSGNFIHENLKLLKQVLQAFDNSIIEVHPVEETENAYVIKFENEDGVIVKNGNIAGQDRGRLSRGTQEAIEIASLLSSILHSKDLSSTFFVDEKMAYSHSEMERAILNVMIEKLNPYSQIFYTTHNYDVLEMNFPSHSFTFLKKDKSIQVSHPEKMGYTQNDRNLLGYVKNDVFNTIPDTSLIEELLWQN